MVCWMLFKSWQLPKWLEGAIGPYKESTSEKPKWRSPTDLSDSRLPITWTYKANRRKFDLLGVPRQMTKNKEMAWTGMEA